MLLKRALQPQNFINAALSNRRREVAQLLGARHFAAHSAAELLP